MANSNLISEIVPKEFIEVIEKVKTNLEIINQLSIETNDLLKSVGFEEIDFSAEVRKEKCIHEWSEGVKIYCVKCGYNA